MLQAFPRENADPPGLIDQLSRLHLSREVSANDRFNGVGNTQINSSNIQVLAPGVALTQDKSLCHEFQPGNPDFDVLSNFICNFSPSRVSRSTCDWISIDSGATHGYLPSPLALAAMKASFEELASAHRRDGNITLTVASLDKLARRHGVTAGKWMMFCTTAEVDVVWERIVKFICFEERRGYARVSPNKGDDQHVVSVYVEDFEQFAEVMRVRETLRRIGFDRPIGFKMDAYTSLGIYKGNQWGINCNRYYE